MANPPAWSVEYFLGLIWQILRGDGPDAGAVMRGTGTQQAMRVEQQVYTTVKTGELAGSLTAVQMPNITCRLVRFKAESGNAGNVYIGVAGVTVADGTTDTTTGYELAAGDSTPWIPVDGLSRFYRISNNAGDDLTYMALE